jgi:hypothetical protein
MTKLKPFKSFVDVLHKSVPGFLDLSVQECVAIIYRHFSSRSINQAASHPDHPGVFIIGVDELIKSESTTDKLTEDVMGRLAKSISAIGSWMDQRCLVDGRRQLIVIPVVTSLSQLLVDDAAPLSGRSITWIPLSPLYGVSHHVCKALGLGEDAAHARHRQTIDTLCRFLGEHGRLVEFLIRIIKDDPSLLNDLEDGDRAIPKIVERLSQDDHAKKYRVFRFIVVYSLLVQFWL